MMSKIRLLTEKEREEYPESTYCSISEGDDYVKFAYLDSEYLEHPIVKTYGTDGTLQESVEYDHGVRHGRTLEYDPWLGVLVRSSSFKTGLEDGDQVSYSTDGRIVEVVSYHEGKKDGISQEFIDDNTVEYVNYIGGKPDYSRRMYKESTIIFYDWNSGVRLFFCEDGSVSGSFNEKTGIYTAYI